MAIFSYVVARDYGFAPNPFGGYCTLATCKPEIRHFAQVGDWVIGTGSAQRQRKDFLVYAMKVAETLTYDEYWDDPRFQDKKPDLQSSKKRAFGDNIYHHNKDGWWQSDSHHSFADGTPNHSNIQNDTKRDRILVATEYAYWGKSGPKFPKNLRNYLGCDICAVRGYKRNFPTGMETEFVAWFLSLNAQGYIDRPLDWVRTP